MKRDASVSDRGILNPDEARRRFHLARPAPSPDLAHLIERYWVITWDLRGLAPFTQETLPQPCVNVVFERGATMAHGVATRRFARELSEAGVVVGVKYRPGAFRAVLGAPVASLTDRSVPLESLGFREVTRTEVKALDADSDDARVEAVEALLRAHLPPRDDTAEFAASVMAAALRDRSLTRAEALATRAGVSLRALQRLFREYVGVSPKWVLRRLRIHEATERMAAGALVEHAALACELGYCDQAHFIRDFRAQVGCTPTEYAARCARAAAAAQGSVNAKVPGQ